MKGTGKKRKGDGGKEVSTIEGGGRETGGKRGR